MDRANSIHPMRDARARLRRFAVLKARARRETAAHRRVITVALVLVATTLAAIGAEALDRYDYYAGDLPDPSTLNPAFLPGATQILDRKGRLLYLAHGDELRIVVPLNRISPLLRSATIDLEDRNFYQHHGLDLPRLVAAAYRCRRP